MRLNRKHPYNALGDIFFLHKLIDYLADKKIHTSVHFKPLYKYTPLKQDREYPVCESEWTKLISLPCHNNMKDEDIDYVVYWVNKYFEENL